MEWERPVPLMSMGGPYEHVTNQVYLGLGTLNLTLYLVHLHRRDLG